MNDVKEWVKGRVSPKRFKHIEGVANTAILLARAVDCDIQQAELAAWLHDCCKEWTAKELISKAKQLGWKLDPAEESQGQLLHGPIGAAVAAEDLGVKDDLVLEAIAQHTLGELNMTKLSKIVYLADCIEPGRSAEFREPIWSALRGEVSWLKFDFSECEFDLDGAMLVACNLSLQSLLADNKPIHHKTVSVRNRYLETIRAR